MFRLKLLILSLLLSESYGGGVTVKINEGLIKGKFMVTKNGRLFTGYTGIPYAEPPVGQLRFMAPVPKKPWDDVKDVSKMHNVCPQRDIYRRTDLIEGDEDCLFLNVYTPKLNYTEETELLPVMLFIHGGGFLAGSAVGYPPEILLDRNVVLVVINYRLGALGFLTTGDEVVPGNNGLNDQNMAIKWTKDNIRTFGGNPSKITLFGESAGGASVNFHMLSPMSKGLFQAGISQSGTALCAWAFAPKGEGVAHGKKLARIFDCPTENSQNMIDCLRRVDPLTIIAQDRKFMKWDTDPMIPFKPCVEPKHVGAFLSQHPIEIIKSGEAAKIPWMTGVNSDDGALRAVSILANAYLLRDFNDEFNRLVPISLLYDKLVENVEYITKKIRNFYFGKGPITSENKNDIINMYTDGWFMAAAAESIRYHMKYINTPVYYYLFGYRGTTSLTGIFGDRINDYGICHADELQYLFPIADALFPEKMQKPDDEVVAELLTTLWVNFANTAGDPTPEINSLITKKWTPVVTEDDMEYYYVGGPRELNMTKGLFLERDRFWRDILENDVSHVLRDEL